MQEHNKHSINTDFIAGRNPVTEALKANRPAESLLVAEGAGNIANIIALAKKRHVTVKTVDSRKLDKMCPGQTHQGVILIAAAKAYSSVADMFALAESRNEPPFLLICDELTDPHNLGALIRSAEACGVHGVIIPERNSVGLTATVAKSSAGAIEYVPVAKVKNLAAALDELKAKGVWLYCADMDGQDVSTVSFTGGVGIIVGSEGKGVGRLIKEKCDFTVAIPMHGRINSLNASVAGAIMMYEASKSRNTSTPKGV